MLKYISCARLQTTVQVRHCRGCKPEKNISFFFPSWRTFQRKKNPQLYVSVSCTAAWNPHSVVCVKWEICGGWFFSPSSSSSSDRWMCFRAAGLGWALLAALHLSEYTSDAAVGEGFYLGSRFNTQQSTPKIDSTFEMPQTPVRCGFKVQNGIATPPCLGWIKKKGNKHPVLPLPATLCFYFCRDWCRQCLVSPQREFFFFPSSFFAALLCGHKWRITWKKTLFVSRRRGELTNKTI